MIERESVIEVLHEIVDPCSAAAGSNIDVVELGLVREVDVTGGMVEIQMRLTTPLCHQVPYFIERAESLVGELPEVQSVTVTTDHGLEWTPEMMSEEAKDRRRSVLNQYRSR